VSISACEHVQNRPSTAAPGGRGYSIKLGIERRENVISHGLTIAKALAIGTALQDHSKACLGRLPDASRFDARGS
jgi:hypothetical protein